MSTLRIVRAGHPALRRIAEAVEDPSDPSVAELVDCMLASLKEAGGVGLAAPQVGVSRRGSIDPRRRRVIPRGPDADETVQVAVHQHGDLSPAGGIAEQVRPRVVRGGEFGR